MFDFSSAELTAWLTANEQWILVGIAATAFLESLAIVGIVVPGVAILFAMAAAAGSADFSLLPVLFAAFIGAVLGDGVSFFLGRHYHDPIKRLSIFKAHPEWMDKGERFFQRYGLISVVIGRFVGPVRPVLPLVAGMLEMPPSRFLTINGLSALGWAPLYILPGYFVGSAAENTSLNHQHIILLLSSIIGGWLLAQIVWWIRSLCIKRVRKIQGAATLFIASSVGLVALYSQLDSHVIQQANQQTAHLFMTLRHSIPDHFFLGLTALGYVQPMVIWGVAVFLALAMQRHWYLVAVWSLVTLLANVLIKGFKLFFAIPRPELVFDPLASYAYPSGHTCIIIVFFFLLLTFTSPALSFRWQKPLLSGAVIIATLMALSRLYLGVHWLTDIIAGICLATAICSATILGMLFKPFAAPNPKPILWACLLALAINLMVWVVPQWQSLSQAHQPLYSNAPQTDQIKINTN